MLFSSIAPRKVLKLGLVGSAESLYDTSRIFSLHSVWGFIMSLYITTPSPTTPRKIARGTSTKQNALFLPGKDGGQMFGLMDPGAPLTDIPSIMRSIEHIICQQSSVVDE